MLFCDLYLYVHTHDNTYTHKTWTHYYTYLVYLPKQFIILTIFTVITYFGTHNYDASI